MWRLRLPLLVLAAAVILAVPVALAAAPHGAQPGQKIDLKVLLLSADGTEPAYEAWKAQLDREGVPYDTFVAYSGATKARTLTDSVLADYGDSHAKYQAVILSTGDLGHSVTNPDATVSFLSALTDPEWAALAKFERTFGIRRMSDFTAPTPAHGLNTVGGLMTDGLVGTLTTAGKAAFPYLKGSVPIANDDPVAAETFGYQATPVNAADWQTLLAGPNNTAYLGIYTHPDDGREEMVFTVASNQYQSHNQLLRHGMLNWVTRGVFLGYQRNYLEMDIDDIFVGNDKWNAATNVTDYEFANAIRMTPADVTNALAWQTATGLKMNMVYNMGGVDLYGGPGGDPLLAALRTSKNQFRWVNHTLEHPNLDCTTANYTSNQLTQNQTQFDSLLGPVSPGLNDPSEAVTGEHSGLANVRPGNPGTIDPPFFNELAPTTGGTLAAGTYDYAITASAAPPSGETVASITPNVTVAAPNNAVRADFNAVCHAVALNLYRKLSTATNWVKVGTLARGARDAVDDGTAPLDLSITDTGAAGTAATLPTSNGAALAPYTQNPSYVPALTAAGIGTVASDSSKPYPNPPTKGLPLSESDPTNFPKGAPFPLSPTIKAVPRYPSNVYYNVANRADQLDEYNWIYVSPPLGNCVPIPNVTTCRTTAATWAEYVNSENTIMFRHLMDNDPRPHFFHQSNLAGYNPALPETDLSNGGILYGVVGALLQRYEAYFNRTSEPLLQLSQTQIGQTLTQQSTWAANRASGKVSAWLQDGRIHVKNSATAPMEVPLTGTTVGGLYGGQKSGWTSIAAGAEQVFAPNDPANTAVPTVSGAAKVGSKLTAANGAWTGTPTIQYDYQWRRCNASGSSCSNLAGATGATHEVTAADVDNTLRVVVSAGNWISSVSQATSSATAAVPEPPKPPKSTGGPGSGSSDPSAGGRLGARSASLALTKLRMSPRRFAVSHRRKQKGTRLDGSRITWKLNKAAKVRLTFQRRAGSKQHRRWVTVGKLSRSAKAGTGVVRFTGRFGKRLLAPRSYRLVVTATKGREKSRPKRITFKVKRG